LAALWIAIPALADGRQEVRFTTEDGVEIVADFVPARQDRSPVVILLHMYSSDRRAWRPLVDALHDSDIAVLAIDLRGHGQSIEPTSMDLRRRVEKRDEELFRGMHRDVFAAYEWLSRHISVDMSRLGLVGASVGCSVALDYAARDRSVDAVVAMTPGENYLGVDSRRHIGQIANQGRRAVLLLATEEERKDCDALGKIDEYATVRIVGPGRVHGTHMFGKIEGIEEQIVEFLIGQLGDPDGPSVVASVDGDEYFARSSMMDIRLERSKRRLFSSAEEAEARGLKRAEGIEASMMEDSVEDREP
jgi:pimeloyl-ACP methyl ester carboxylesterase